MVQEPLATSKPFIIFNFIHSIFCRKIILQCCAGSCHITTWISYNYTYIYTYIYIPSLFSLPPFPSSYSSRCGTHTHTHTHTLSVSQVECWLKFRDVLPWNPCGWDEHIRPSFSSDISRMKPEETAKEGQFQPACLPLILSVFFRWRGTYVWRRRDCWQLWGPLNGFLHC